MRYVILLVPAILMSCAPAPYAEVKGQPWAFMTESDWKGLPEPGDSAIEVSAWTDFKLLKDTWSRGWFPIPDRFTGTAYMPVGATCRIAKLTFQDGIVKEVEYVHWRAGCEGMRSLKVRQDAR